MEYAELELVIRAVHMAGVAVVAYHLARLVHLLRVMCRLVGLKFERAQTEE